MSKPAATSAFDAPQLLALIGLVPFLVLALGVVTGRLFGAGPSLYALQIYAAVSLSFLGGIHTGMAMRDQDRHWRRHAVAALPIVAAWAGVWFAGARGLLVLAAGFAVLLVYDLWTVSKGEIPPWYGTLRLRLTPVIVAALLATAHFGPF